MKAAHADAKTPVALLATVVLLLLSHSLTMDSASTWLRSLPFLLILVLGELVREFVVAHVPATADTALRSRRRRLAVWCGVGGALIAAFGVAALALHWIPPRSNWIFPLFIAWMVAWSVAAGMTFSDMAQKARARPVSDRVPPSPLVRLSVLLATLLWFGLINVPLYETLQSGHALSVPQLIRFVVSAIACVAFVVAIWRHLDRDADQQSLNAPEEANG